MQEATRPPAEQPEVVADESRHATSDAVEDFVSLCCAETALVNSLLETGPVLLDESINEPVDGFPPRRGYFGQRAAVPESSTKLALRDVQVVGRGPEDFAERAREAVGPGEPQESSREGMATGLDQPLQSVCMSL
jgi:hypothetical protein